MNFCSESIVVEQQTDKAYQNFGTHFNYLCSERVYFDNLIEYLRVFVFVKKKIWNDTNDAVAITLATM